MSSFEVGDSDDEETRSTTNKFDDYYVVEFRDAQPTIISRQTSSATITAAGTVVSGPNELAVDSVGLADAETGTLKSSVLSKRVGINPELKPPPIRTQLDEFMALCVKVNRVTGVSDPRQSYYVSLDFKSSLYKSTPVQAERDCVKINQLFSWPLGTPLGEEDRLIIKLHQAAKVRGDKVLSVLPISLQQVVEVKRIEVNEIFVNADTNQPTSHRIEMEITYAAPGDEEGQEALQRALLQQIASGSNDADEQYDSVSMMTSTTTPDTDKKKKKGIMSKFAIKPKKKAKDGDAQSVFELEPMIVTNPTFFMRRGALAMSASNPELCNTGGTLLFPSLADNDEIGGGGKKGNGRRSPRLAILIDITESSISPTTQQVTSKTIPSVNVDEEFNKYDDLLDDIPDAEFISHRKRIDRLYKCRNYDALQVRSYQIHVTIAEARQLSGSNIDPVVTVTVGTEKKSTAVKTSTNCPYYNEFMVFDFRMPQQALLEQVINVSVLHSKKLLSDEMIGMFRVDVNTVYRNHDHTIGQKWVQLADPNDLCSPPKGYVKLTIAVIAKGDLVGSGAPGAAEGDDNIEKNLFTMGSSSADGLWQTARYNLRIYQAEQLPSASSTGLMTGFKRALKSNDAALLDPFVIALFAGQQGRTTVKKATTSPEWNEQISFIDMFPPPCRRLAIQVRDSGISDNLIACHYIDVYTVSNEGKHHTGGYLPVYGPAWVNLYGALDPTDEGASRFGEPQAYRGRILIELHTELLDQPEPTAISVVSDVCTACDKTQLPIKADLLLMCGIHNVDMIDSRYKDKPLHLQLSLGPYPEIASPGDVQGGLHKNKSSTTLRSEDSTPLLAAMNEKGEPDKVTHMTPALAVKSGDGDFGTIPLQAKKPLLAIHYAYEDQRKQAAAVNMLEKIFAEMDECMYRSRQALKLQRTEVAVANVARALKNVIIRANTFARLSKSAGVVIRQTRLFDCWIKQTKDALTEIVTQCSRAKHSLGHNTVQEALATISRSLGVIESLLMPREQDFPDLFIWLVTHDQRKIGYAKLSIRSLHYSEVPEECGTICGKLETFRLLAPDRTNTHVANVCLTGWHGLHKDWSRSFELLPKALHIPGFHAIPSHLVFKDVMHFQLRGYLYQARGIRGLDDTGLSDPFAAIHVQSRSIQTRVINETLSPIWDETLVISDIELHGNRHSISDRPPVVTIYIYDYDDPESCELIGVAHMVPTVRFSSELARYNPPQLQWFKLISPRNFNEAGEVLAAAELLQIEDGPDGISQLPLLDIPEEVPSGSPMPVPRGIRPTLSRYRIEILFWGLRELTRLQLLSVDRPRLDIELSGQTIQSDVIQNAQHFPNFVCLIKAIEMDLPDNDIFCPPLMIRCVDCRSFGRQLLVGSAAVPNISAFFLNEDNALDASTVDMDESSSIMELDDESASQKTSVLALARSIPTMMPASPSPAPSVAQLRIDDYLVPSTMTTAIAPVDPYVAEGVDGAIIPMDEIDDAINDGASSSDLKSKLKGKKYRRVKIRIRMAPLDERGRRTSRVGAAAPAAADATAEAAPANDDEETDWWTKYYATTEETKKKEQEAASLAGKTLMTGGMGSKGKLKIFSKSAGKGAKALKGLGGLGGKEKRPEASPSSYDNSGYQCDDHGHGHYQSDAVGGHDSDSDKEAPGKKNKIDNVRAFRIYNTELEAVFSQFEDFVRTFELHRGKEDEDADPAQKKNLVTGKFKGNFRVSRLSTALVGQKPVREDNTRPIMFQNLPPSSIVPLVVRVYIVRAYDLYPKDMNGKSDPYITIRLGKTVIKDNDNYISKQLNPIFGRCFDVKATLPFDNMLTVQIFDWDLVGSDDLIGETKIDIENRFYSKYRPTCGLPLCYERGGYNAWRDANRPTQLLNQLCRREGFDPPIYETGKVVVNNKMYVPAVPSLPSDEPVPDANEHLALGVLNHWDKVAGHKLVPEHIENRLLFDPAQPGQVMGQLEMWVDMFPSDKGSVPPPIDISPRKPKSYELRCIIWNTEDVILDDVSITGEKMSDIYVKGYLTGPDDTQATDVHYRSLTGEGNFNWRFVFKFDYLSCEQRIVVKRKETLLSWDETEEKLPARLTLQVWDADLVGSDDFLGSLTLDLNCLPRGAKDGKDCSADMVAPDSKTPLTSLFKQRRMRGFWPFTVKNETTQEIELTGKVEAEFQLLSSDEASARPAGLGRDPPDPMDKPNRPDTSFLWFTSPFKSLQYILCNKFKWLFIKLLIISAFAAILVLFIYSLPGHLSQKMVAG